jgi:DNA polymerase V
MKYIGLLDCNNFFVSCERVFRPDLANQPVLVMSSNDGCVVARSQEVKDMGIPMGVPVFQIKDIIKDKQITTFSSNFTLYRDFSRRVFLLLKEMVPQMEQYSIDEAFFTSTFDSPEEAVKRLQEIRTHIIKATGIPVSIGLSYTKTQAKHASKVAKKSNGVFVATTDWWTSNAALIPLGDIWGVGRQLRERYTKYQIVSVADLISAPTATVEHVAGVVGRRLQDELCGVSIDVVTNKRSLPKSIMSTQSFGVATSRKTVVLEALFYHLDQIIDDLRTYRLNASVLHVVMRPSRYQTDQYFPVVTHPLGEPTRDLFYLREVIKKVVQEHFNDEILYKKAGIYVTGLVPEDQVTLSLLPDESLHKKSDISSLLESLPVGFRQLISPGGNYQKSWRAKRDQVSPSYTTDWTAIPNVRT